MAIEISTTNSSSSSATANSAASGFASLDVGNGTAGNQLGGFASIFQSVLDVANAAQGNSVQGNSAVNQTLNQNLVQLQASALQDQTKIETAQENSPTGVLGKDGAAPDSSSDSLYSVMQSLLLVLQKIQDLTPATDQVNVENSAQPVLAVGGVDQQNADSSQQGQGIASNNVLQSLSNDLQELTSKLDNLLGKIATPNSALQAPQALTADSLEQSVVQLLQRIQDALATADSTPLQDQSENQSQDSASTNNVVSTNSADIFSTKTNPVTLVSLDVKTVEATPVLISQAVSQNQTSDGLTQSQQQTTPQESSATTSSANVNADQTTAQPVAETSVSATPVLATSAQASQSIAQTADSRTVRTPSSDSSKSTTVEKNAKDASSTLVDATASISQNVKSVDDNKGHNKEKSQEKSSNNVAVKVDSTPAKQVDAQASVADDSTDSTPQTNLATAEPKVVEASGSKVNTDAIASAHDNSNVQTDASSQAVKIPQATLTPQSHYAERLQEHVALRQVSQRIQWMVNNQEGRATLRLDPPELGHIELEVQTKDGEMKVHMTVDNDEVKQALESSVSDLRVAMESHNIKLDRLEVQVDSGRGDPNAQRRDGAHSGKRQSSQGNRGTRFADTSVIASTSDTGRRLGYNTMELIA